MGKDKKKAKVQKMQRQTEKERFKFYTKASAMMVKDNLELVEFDDLVTGIYLHTKDEEVNYLLKKVEKELLLCKLDFEKFNKELHEFYSSMADEIREKKLAKKFYKLCHYIYVAMQEKNTERDITSAYFNFVMQLGAYLPKSTSKNVYGIRTDNTLMLRGEPMRNLSEINDIIMSEAAAKMEQSEIFAIYHKHGYKHVKSFIDMVKISTDDQMVSNMLFHMAYFINEQNEDIVCLPYHLPNDMPIYSGELHASRSVLLPQTLHKLQAREHLLPSEGIIAKTVATSSIDEIFMEETIVDESIILLYRLKINGGYLAGYFDTRREVFYSPWEDSDHEVEVHNPLELMVLQMYMYLTCTLTKEEKDSLYILGKFGVEYDMRIKGESKRTYERMPYDRNKYLAELIDISPFLRHLPVGAEASDDARAMARKLGLELPKGMTLVKGFRRKSWVKDEVR